MANTQNKLTKTGECNFRDELGNLCLAESFQDETTGEVPTKVTILEEAVIAR